MARHASMPEHDVMFRACQRAPRDAGDLWNGLAGRGRARRHGRRVASRRPRCLRGRRAWGGPRGRVSFGTGARLARGRARDCLLRLPCGLRRSVLRAG